MTNNSRYQHLCTWLQQQTGFQNATPKPASADASFRRYFRATNVQGQSYILMDAPPEKEDLSAFIHIAAQIRDAGLNAPKIYAQDLEQGYLRLSDLGEQLYLKELEQNRDIDRLYSDALSALNAMQSCIDPCNLPAYDNTLLQQELQLFPDWYLNQQLKYTPSAEQSQILQNSFDFLCQQAQSQPQVFVHRDYHSRNLLKAPHNPGIIDFQDAVCGAITYDLVSLLRDAYYVLPQSAIDDYVQGYYKLAQHSGLLTPEHSPEQFKQWFDFMGLQRHLKVVGIFSRLAHRDHKTDYLDSIPTVYRYLLDISAKYPETQALHHLLQELPHV